MKNGNLILFFICVLMHVPQGTKMKAKISNCDMFLAILLLVSNYDTESVFRIKCFIFI